MSLAGCGNHLPSVKGQGSRVKGEGKNSILGVDKTSPFTLHPSPSASLDGFTFVELLIAVTMMSILFVGLGAHLRGGLIVWQEATRRGEALQRQRMAFDRLDRDLTSTFVYDSRVESYGEASGKLPAPQFGKDVLVLFTVERLPVGLSTVPGTVQAGLTAVRVVTYRCEEREGTRGLWRTSQSVGEARAKLEPVADLLLEGCSALQLRYAQISPENLGALEWGPFPNENTLTPPRLITVSLELNPGERLERVCAVPIGALLKAKAP